MNEIDLRTVKSLGGTLKGTRVLLRVGFNVPIKDGEIENDYRIRQTLPTIAWLKSEGARIILMSHIWGDESTSLKIVHEYLQKHMELMFVEDFEGEESALAFQNMKDGDVVLLENLRLHDGEKLNDPAFAEALSKLGDIYVNDAFSVSHRAHASIVGIPEYLPAYAGLRMTEEVASLAKAFEAVHPFVFVLGGAKFETKIPIVSKFLNTADKVYVAGALAHPYLEAQGVEVGLSLVDEKDTPLGTASLDEKLVTPIDMISLRDAEEHTMSREEVTEKDSIQDIGPKTLDALCSVVRDAGMVVWNGPLGNYENGFYSSTQDFARALAESDAISIVGGGDTIAAISALDLEDEFDFVSTGGGAMLDFLLNETLPGLEPLRNA